MKQINIMICLSFALILFACEKDDAFLKIEKTKREQIFNCEGGNFSIPVNSNKEYNSEITEGADWLEIEQIWQQVKVKVKELRSGVNREGKIKITSKNCTPIEVVVKQNAITLINDMDKITATNSKKTITIKLSASVAPVFTLPEWIKPIDTEWIFGSKDYTFEISPNYESSTDIRNGKIIINSSDKENNFNKEIEVEQANVTNEAIKNIIELWNTNPLEVKNVTSDKRYSILSKIEEYSNLYIPSEFKSYLEMNDTNAAKEEEDKSIISCYKYAFNKILDEVKSSTVENGTTQIWCLYNMGFIVKTPKVCFGIDINHRYAKEFAPYLDFLCITHNHSDHIDANLMASMSDMGKPIVSNFYTSSPKYLSKVPSTYDINGIKIKTAISDHDVDTPNFDTMFRIDCGEESGNFTMLHSGDSSFNPDQYVAIEGGKINLLIIRFGNKSENNIIGTGSGQVEADYTCLSHVSELRHYIDKSPMRATIKGAIGNMINNINTPNKFLPFWGERLIWKNGQLSKYTTE